MPRVELNYLYKDQKNGAPFSMEGKMYIKGIGTCQIESNNDAGKTVSLTMISSLVEPRNSRLIAVLNPGQSFSLVRPTATLVVKNTESPI